MASPLAVLVAILCAVPLTVLVLVVLIVARDQRAGRAELGEFDPSASFTD